MKIGLIDVDNSNKFPNLALMKISGYYKKLGYDVEWYNPMFNNGYDVVYVSKVFEKSLDYQYFINAKNIKKGGVAYSLTENLPNEIENSYPDYELYNFVGKNKAYGFLTRGCPRQCSFCNVSESQGKKSVKVADLSQFWNGQKEIILLDPNILACKDWKELFQQLIDSKAKVDFTQGLDIRLMTDEKVEMLNKIKIKKIHFALDNAEDIETIEKLKYFRDKLKFKKRQLGVYILINFNTTLKQDIDRIKIIDKLDYDPYIMVYNKHLIKRGDIINKIQRTINNKFIYYSLDIQNYNFIEVKNE